MDFDPIGVERPSASGPSRSIAGEVPLASNIRRAPRRWEAASTRCGYLGGGWVFCTMRLRWQISGRVGIFRAIGPTGSERSTLNLTSRKRSSPQGDDERKPQGVGSTNFKMPDYQEERACVVNLESPSEGMSSPLQRQDSRTIPPHPKKVSALTRSVQEKR